MDPLELVVEAQDGCTTTIIHPDMAVVKECTAQAHPGDEIEVAPTVTNPGDIALSDVAVSDSLAGDLDYVSGDANDDGLLDTDETWVFEGSYAAPQADTSSNTVTASGMDPLELVVEAQDGCTTDILSPAIAVVKECSGLVHEGDEILVFAFVENPGDIPLSDVQVNDSLAGSLAYVIGDDRPANGRPGPGGAREG